MVLAMRLKIYMHAYKKETEWKKQRDLYGSCLELDLNTTV